MYYLFHRVILTKLLFDQFCTLSYFTMCSILIVHSVPYISFPYVNTLVYRSSLTGTCRVFGGTHAHLAQEAWFAPSFVHLVEHMA